MVKAEHQVAIPITNTGRKYGYLTWYKESDDKIKAVFGRKHSIDLQIENSLQKDKKIDWKKRRVSIGPSVTRSLPQNVQTIRLKRRRGGRNVILTFE